MQPSETIARLASQLGPVQWTTSASTLLARLASYGFEVVRETPHRVDLRHTDTPGVRCALYRTARLECTVRIVMEPHELEESEWSRANDEFLATWRESTAALAASLGEPRFLGGPGDAGMAEGEDAVRLAAWSPQSGRTLAVQYRHEDRELPMRLVLVVTPT